MSNVHRHLLPHVTDTSVVTALFTDADFTHDNDPVTTSTPIAGVADTTSRTGGWSKAATEAVNTCDEDRLDRLARYSQRGVRRAVVTNPRVSDDTLRYLLHWAVAKNDDTLLAQAAEHQPVGRLIDAAGDQLPAAVRGGMALRLMAANAVMNGPVADLVRFYTHAAIPQAAEEVVKWYDVFVRRYSSVQDDGPVIAFDELHRLAQRHTDRVPVDQLWMVGQMDRPIASVLVATSEPTGDRHRRVGANDCDVDAAVLLVEQQPGWNAALYAALSAREALPGETYDAILDALEAGSQDDWSERYRLLRRVVDNHLGHLSGAQADRFVDLLDGLYDDEYASSLTLLFDATFKEAGHLVDSDRARRLIEGISPSLIVGWATNATASYEVTELMRELDPVLLDALARRQIGDADGIEWRWISTVLDDLEGRDGLQQTLLDAAGPAALRLHHFRPVAAALAAWFTREFGDDVERWHIALGLIEGWSGTVSDLIEAAHALSGGRPAAPQAASDQPVHATGAQMGLFD